MKVHPNLLKRVKKFRDAMVGKFAVYSPENLTLKLEDIEYGEIVQIIHAKKIGGKTGTVVRANKKEYPVLLSDLSFIGIECRFNTYSTRGLYSIRI